MTGNIRTAVLGMLAGAAASAPLALSLGHPRSSVALGMAIGIAYAVGTRRTPQAYVDNLMAAGALGVFAQALSDLAEHVFGPEAGGVAPVPQQRKQIVILGGGFAGMKTAECLEQELHTNSSAMITLISETNALLFTPMLAEVAGSTLEPSH